MIIPLGLRIGFVCLTEIWMGNISPGRPPGRSTLVVAVMVSPETPWFSSLRVFVPCAEFESLITWKLWVLLLTQLELLCSLGTGLRGGLVSELCDEGSTEEDTLLPVDICSPDVDFVLDFVFDRFDIRSRETTRGLGMGKGAMSTVSRNMTRLSQDMAGEIVVGRVKVEVIM